MKWLWKNPEVPENHQNDQFLPAEYKLSANVHSSPTSFSLPQYSPSSVPFLLRLFHGSSIFLPFLRLSTKIEFYV